MAEIKQTEFWRLSSPQSNRGLAEWADDGRSFESVSCPADPGHRRGGRRVGRLDVFLTSRRIGDFVWTWYSDCLIRDSSLSLLRDEGLTGFDVRPVQAHMKTRARRPDPCDENPGLKERDAVEVEIPKLWELVVTGWGGMARPESGVHLVQECSECGLLTYTTYKDPALLVDERQWDGSDFFMVWPLPMYILVTQRVVNVIRSHRLTGATLVPIGKLMPSRPDGTLSPGRLSYWMPEPRARQLGEPLGVY